MEILRFYPDRPRSSCLGNNRLLILAYLYAECTFEKSAKDRTARVRVPRINCHFNLFPLSGVGAVDCLYIRFFYRVWDRNEIVRTEASRVHVQVQPDAVCI